MLASAALILPAGAQVVDRGNDVIVNPVIPRGQSTRLLYPGGRYIRVVPPLLEPGETARDLGPIHLHMPTKRQEAHEAAVAEQPAPAPEAKRQTKAPRKVAARPAKQAPAKEAKAMAPKRQPKVAAHPAYNPGFGADHGAAGLDFSTMSPAPKPKAKTNSAQNKTDSAHQKMASVEPAKPALPPAATPATPGLTKRSVILFAPKAADPAQSALGAIKFLAGDLNAAMTAPGSRIQIQAFGGTRGDKGSDARRLSLKRGLAIRQVLIDDGVPAERIDVRAMGGADDSGPADRVDVYVKT